MSKAILVKRIARRTGIAGIPRMTTLSGSRKIEPGENTNKVVREILAMVKQKTQRDGNDRQIELATVKTLKSGRHKISSRVLYRVYRSHSDHKVYVYAGEAHQGARG